MINKYKTGKLSPKGVVAIPIKVRSMLGVDAGDQLEFEKKGDEVVVRGIKKKSILDAYRSLDTELKSPLVNVREVRE